MGFHVRCVGNKQTGVYCETYYIHTRYKLLLKYSKINAKSGFESLLQSAGRSLRKKGFLGDVNISHTPDHSTACSEVQSG